MKITMPKRFYDEASHSLHETKGSFNPPTVNINGDDWMQDYLAIDDGGPGIYRQEKTGTLCYTIQAALRVAKNLPGWRLPNEEEIEALPLNDVNLKNTGAVDLDRSRPSSFGDDTPYLMGTKHVFFPSFGSSWASFNNANHAAPVKLIKGSVPTHTYQTPLARGTINDDGNFNGSYWSERHYKYDEMHRRVKSIVEDWTQRMKKKYPDVADVIYTKISEPRGRQSCMLVEYRTPLAEAKNLLEALRPTAVSIRNYLGPYEIKDIIYGGPEVGYYTRETGKHDERLTNCKGESKMKPCSMVKKIESLRKKNDKPAERKKGVVRMPKLKIEVKEEEVTNLSELPEERQVELVLFSAICANTPTDDDARSTSDSDIFDDALYMSEREYPTMDFPQDVSEYESRFGYDPMLKTPKELVDLGDSTGVYDRFVELVADYRDMADY